MMAMTEVFVVRMATAMNIAQLILGVGPIKRSDGNATPRLSGQPDTAQQSLATRANESA